MLKITARPSGPILDAAEWSSISPILQGIYAARGIQHKTDISHELINLLPYEKLKNITAAVELLAQALQQQWRLLVIGDFDVDGATSSVLAIRVLRAFGAKYVDYLVPNRFTYGYGLSPGIVAVAAATKQPQLIITVDNGIASIEGVAAARAAGIKVLITDHHIAGECLPAAEVIINPNQPGDEFGSKNLAGVGVIFYVLLALRRYLCDANYFTERAIAVPNMANYLDLVALGTVADVVPLDRNNRILVAQGLLRIRAKQCCPGISALLDIAKREHARLLASDLGFAVGPRLNAAGRLEDMALGIECLLTDDAHYATAIARQLDTLNQQRRDIEATMSDQAFAILKNLQLTDIPLGLCLYDATWHQGVIGILASRIKDKYHRPVIVFAQTGTNEIKGSARSVSGVHIRDVLEAIAKKYPALLSKFGGHAMAAGLSLAKSDLAAFQTAFVDEIAARVNIDALQGYVYSDGQLSSTAINVELAQQLGAAGPWGQAFTEPLFDGVFTLLEQRLVGQKHLKLTLKQDDNVFSAIAFNINPQLWPNYRCEKIQIVYRLAVNEFRNMASVQLVIEQCNAV